MVRFFLGLGRDHNVAPKDIVGAISGETGIPGKSIGAIRILDTYSFVEVPRDCAEEVYTIMKERTRSGASPPGSNRRRAGGSKTACHTQSSISRRSKSPV